MEFKFKFPTVPGQLASPIPILGQGLQKYNIDDTESIDPTNTMKVFKNEVWPNIKQYFGNNKRVLDVGCGNGRFSSFLSDHAQEVVAIDAFREIKATNMKDNIVFLKKSLQEYEDDGFDVVFLFGVFYLQESWGTNEAFESMVLKLNPGGVIITVDDKKRDLRIAPSNELPPGLYNLGELCSKNNVSIENEFVQENNVHRITVIRK